MIGRKVLLSGLKEVINTLEKDNHSQNIADAVVKGRSGKVEKKKKKEKVVNKQQASAKRKSVVLGTSQPKTVKARKYSNWITGFVTVLD